MMSKAQEIVEELDALEEASPNYTKLNAMINQIAMSRDTGKGKGDDPKFKKDAQSLLKKMTDDEELSPNDMKKLAGRLSKAMGESLNEKIKKQDTKTMSKLNDLSNETIIGAIKDSKTMDLAAEKIGCSRQGLYYQMKKRGIRNERDARVKE